MSQKKILLVDDDNDLRSVLSDALETASFTVLQAKDGEEGLALALAEKPDLILLDIMMPKFNGHQTLRALRKDAWGKTAKVILLTSLDDATNVTEAVEQKSNDYIMKSNTSLEDIIKKIKQHLAGYYDKH